MEEILKKQCSKCKEFETLEEFYKRKDNKSGFRKDCKKCNNGVSRKYHNDNKEKTLLQNKQYQKENKEEIKKQRELYREQNREKINTEAKEYRKREARKIAIKDKERYEKNKDNILMQKKEYREKNKEKINTQRKGYRKNNREVIQKRQKSFYKDNPELFSTHRHERRARIKQSKGKFTSEELSNLVEKSNNKCCYCLENLPNREYQADHFIPLSKGGTNYIENIKISCPTCNFSKHAKMPHVWLREQGWLEKYNLESTRRFLKT